MQKDPTNEFDFWVGTWNLETETRSNPTVDQWKKSKSKNHVEKILDGQVIQENFSGAGLVGKSWSTYDSIGKVWRQTWVDNGGGYIVLSGKMENGVMVLLDTPLNPQSRPHRMTFKDITPKSFNWVWEVQTKDGNWAPMFKCKYVRVGS